MAKILCIDYDVQFRRKISELLTLRGHQVVTCECPEDAFRILEEEDFELIVSELYLPFSVKCLDVDKSISYEVGVKLVRALQWALPDTKVVGLSSLSRSNLLRIAKFLTTVPIVSKPITYVEAADLIEGFLVDDHVSAVH